MRQVLYSLGCRPCQQQAVESHVNRFLKSKRKKRNKRERAASQKKHLLNSDRRTTWTNITSIVGVEDQQLDAQRQEDNMGI